MTRQQWDALVEHAREEEPRECLGWMTLGDDGRVERVERATEASSTSRYGFVLEGSDLLAVWKAEEAGAQVAVYHSHPRSEPRPSQQDINLAEWPSWLWVIVSLAGDEPKVRAWRIADGRVDEEEIVVTG